MHSNSQKTRISKKSQQQIIVVDSKTRIPPFLIEPPFAKTFRYISTGSGSNVQYTVSDFAQLWCMAATTTSGYSLYAGWRIRRIKLWSVATALNTAATCALEWAGGTNQSLYSGSTKSDQTLSPYEYAHISCKPPPGSSGSFWNNVSTAGGPTNGVIQLTFSANSVLELDMQLVMISCEPAASNNGALTLAAATVGRVYFPSFGRTNFWQCVSPGNNIQ